MPAVASRSHGLLILLAVSLAAVATPTAAGPAGSPHPVITTISNRPDLVSGGDVLVEVRLPTGIALSEVVINAGSTPVTDAFEVRGDGRTIGLVEGLPLGESVLTVRLPDGSGATLDVTNHPIGGPVFAGPQVMPWPCATEENGLGPPTDEQCNVEEVVHELLYWSTDNGFRNYDPDDPPDDVAMTTTDEGIELPFIVRRERGVIDRAMYDIAVLFDPARPDWDRWDPPPGWNGKVHWTFGGSCQPYHGQVAPDARPDIAGAPGVMDDQVLGRGFAVATSAMSTLGNNCNTVVSAEATMMVKEHFIETYGDIRYILGLGGSGGSIQQIQTADAYPGLFDGIIPQSTFADIVSTAQENLDCRLLVHYFNGEGAPLGWTPAQQAAVQAGVGGTSATCEAWVSAYGFPAVLAAPTLGCRVPLLTYIETDATGILQSTGEPDWVYDPDDNPSGVRCTIYDYMAAIFGTDPATGFAERPFDNTGVQYGLEALQAGLILPEQFVHLNETIGSLDLDYTFQPARVQASEGVVARAHASGQVTSGRWLRDVPILDASYAVPHGDIHTAFHAWSLHERILAAGGNGETHVIRQRNDGPPLFDVMDEWLTAIEADTEPGSKEDRVVRTRPAGAVPAGDYLGTNPRIGSGAPLADNVVKCQLKPVDTADYGPLAPAFTPDQLGRLDTVFPGGVCDYALPGVGVQDTIPWATYAGGDGPVPLGPPPESVPFDAGLAIERYAGAERVATAVAVSGAGVDESDTVVLARADDFADALAGAPLAVELDAPLLLTGTGAVPTATMEEIQRLGAAHVILLGGTAAIGAQVEVALNDAGMTVDRVAGPNRFGTAVEIRARLAAEPDRDVLAASGYTFAEALAASALGAVDGTPLLLTAAESLPVETAEVLGPNIDVTLVGAEAVAPAAVASAIDEVAGSVARLSGDTSIGTAIAVAEEAVARGADPSVVWVATSQSFPDALVAGAAAGRDHGVLLLVDGMAADLPESVRQWLIAHIDDIDVIRLAGGSAAISTELEAALAGLG